MFVFSAKTNESLREIIIQLYEDLLKRERVSIKSISYTLSVGRSHYEYRLAFLATSLEDLLKRLKSIIDQFDNILNLGNVYYRYHHIVPEYKETKNEEDLTILMKHKMERQSKDELNKAQNYDVDAMKSLLRFYTHGADIDWGSYFDEYRKKTHLPTYPFMQKSVWFNYKSESSYFHYKRWELESVTESSDTVASQTILYFHSQENGVNVTDYFRSEGQTVIDVFSNQQDTGHVDLNDNQYYISYNEESFNNLFAKLEGLLVHKIVFELQYDEKCADTEEELDRNVKKCFFEPLYMVKGIAKAHFGETFELVFLVRNVFAINNKESILNPQHAMTVGLGRVIEQEFPNIISRVIDIGHKNLVESAAKEILCDASKSYIIGLRDEGRYVEILDEVELELENSNILRKDGVYIITGGTSGIGLETAYYLSKAGCRNLVLLSRTPLPTEEQWDTVCANDDNMRQVIGKLRQIRENGSNIKHYACDVSHFEQMKKVADDIRKNIGDITGIFHSAGITDAGFIMRKDEAEYHNVLAPKVKGTWVLDKVTCSHQPEFMVLYSSAITYMGEAGQSDYVAANTYLDAYSDYRNMLGYKTYCINWVSWKETGMSVRFGINKDSLTKVLTTKIALEKLDAILKSNCKKVMIGQYNYQHENIDVLNNGRYLLSSGLNTRMKEARKDEKIFSGKSKIQKKQYKNKVILLPNAKSSNSIDEGVDNVILMGKSEGEYTELEYKLSNIYSRILGYSQIDIYNNFFEMGGDSIMIMRMYQQIDKMFPSIITSADLFEFTTIASLADYIYKKQSRRQVKINSDVKVERIDFKDVDKMEKNVFDLSSAQQRIFIETKLNSNKRVYNNPFAFSLDTPVTHKELKKCVGMLIKRHGIMRTSFQLVGRRVKQIIHSNISYEIDTIIVDHGQSVNLREYLSDFDLAKPPLFKIREILQNGKQIILFDLHHIIADGYSSSILVNELISILDNKPLQPLDNQYIDFVDYEKQYINSEACHSSVKFWSKVMHEVSEATILPADSIREGLKDLEYSPLIQKIKNDLENQLQSVANICGVSLFSVLLGALYITLGTIGSKEGITVGIPVLGRDKADFMKTVGNFVNILPVYIRVDKDKTLHSYFRDVFKTIQNFLKHQMYPFNYMIDDRRKRDESTDLFSVMFDYENESIQLYDRSAINGVSYVIDQWGSRNDIDIKISKHNNQLVLCMNYNNKLYRDKSIHNLMDMYFEVLNKIPNVHINNTIKGLL